MCLALLPWDAGLSERVEKLQRSEATTALEGALESFEGGDEQVQAVKLAWETFLPFASGELTAALSEAVQAFLSNSFVLLAQALTASCEERQSVANDACPCSWHDGEHRRVPS